MALTCVVTSAFIYVFFRFFDASEVLHTISTGNRRDVLAGVFVVAITINLRALRLCRCAGAGVTANIIATAYLYNALAAALPAKLGEVSLPLLLKREAQTPLGSGVGLLILLRLLDLLALGTLGSLLVAAAVYTMDKALAMTASLVGFGSILALGLLLIVGPAIGKRMAAHHTSRHAILRLAHRIASPLARITRRRLAELVVLSLAIWTSLFTSFYFLAHAILDSVGPLQIGTAGTAASLAFAVPASAIANIGPFQIAWVWTLAQFGIDNEPALASALLVHGAILIMSLIFGAVGFARLSTGYRRRTGA